MIHGEVLERIVTLLTDAPQMSGVSVHPGFPGDKVASREMVWIEDLTSTLDIPVGTGAAKHYDDVVSMRVIVRVAGEINLMRARLRGCELQREILRVLATDVTLGDLEVPGIGHVIEAKATAAMEVGQDTPSDGPLEFAAIDLDVHTRITWT